MPVIPFQESKGVSAKKVLTENAQSPKPFDAHTLRSKLSSYDLKLLWERCEISPTIKLRLPDEGESANMTAIDKISVYWDMFINGFRVPLHPFFIKVFNAYGLAPGQFSPHAWSFISFFIYQCYKLGLRARIRHPKAEANLFSHPSSFNHHWKEKLLFVKLPKSQWGEVCNVWLHECETKTCNALKERDLSESNLENIKKLKRVEPLESRYPLSNAQHHECGIIFFPKLQDFEEEGENDHGGPHMDVWVLPASFLLDDLVSSAPYVPLFVVMLLSLLQPESVIGNARHMIWSGTRCRFILEVKRAECSIGSPVPSCDSHGGILKSGGIGKRSTSSVKGLPTMIEALEYRSA
ncbi:hypothetical protein RJ639_024009 [Escallonia herrerae]|uniref:Transposase (putative) gypsy type domain-containing protein n=1 Tax=Escallonia herrerae TaxID=1293975 RepID=A0AA88UZJ3_9ASTE|nr:hypothetical protein RJ639_024009 [Escallonia herrerae]